MAKINVPNTAAFITSRLDPRVLAPCSFGDALEFPNPDNNKGRGITMCYGDPEGIAAITRAYDSLTEEQDINVFGLAVAEAIDQFASFFPEGEHNLCYPHFLLHGIARPTLTEVVEQIRNNARIIIGTLSVRDSIRAQFGKPRLIDGGLSLCIRNGLGDDFDGLSFQLFHPDQPLSDNNPFAKAGFVLDTSINQATVVNLQGRKKQTSEDPMSKKQYRAQGRAFARFPTDHNGLDPRAFVLNHLCEFLGEIGIKTVRAIRPEEHLMHIGKHPGFRANYDEILEIAGFHVQDQVYRLRELRDT